MSNEGGGFGPLLFVTGGLAVGLLAALPSSIGDCLRAGEALAQPLSVLAANFGALFLSAVAVQSQVKNRTRKIQQLARELALGDLRVVTTDRLGNERYCNLRDLRRNRRVALLYGTREKLLADVSAAHVYRRRLADSSILVVPVLADSSSETLARISPPSGRTLHPPSFETWLAWPTVVSGGFNAAEYFEDLLGGASSPSAIGAAGIGAYITLGIDGRVRGSGEGSPFWDVLLSTFPQQAIIGEEKDTRRPPPPPSLDDTVGSVMLLHEQFYEALDEGDTEKMAPLWGSPAAISPAMTDYQSRGAALDGWPVVLREDRRPIGMTVSDVDITVDPCRTRATLTCIETVAGGTTLLATQTFMREDKGCRWSFTGHKTIPYGKEIVAKIVLECDARGCMALPAKAVASSVSASRFQLKQ